ncbi:substrate-binding domain-containing protein [Pararhizobium haloflavum]|uniref:substrate-binding domain-containing protein n=1 Tax=Pararhizobium haloflavum TaxID=2037914 RepID=UPI000C1A3496|nr:substrate-binding domain-containing protein [Pararhizobium haloflavum]
MNALKLSVAALVASTAFVGYAAAQTREQIQIVGSSTVFPYTQAVVEQFSNTTDFAAPVLESTGTGGGMQIFCEGVGEEFPDITGASRAMTEGEYELCVENGVEDITEVQIGSDGLSIAVSRDGETFDVTKAQLFQALAAQVEVDGEIVDNPYTNWSEIDDTLPDAEIEAFGPPPTSGTRDAFVELVMMEGCSEFEAIAALGEEEMEETCSRMRQDGPFVEAGENDNLIVQRLQQNPEAVGIFGYSFLYENMDTLQPVSIEGVEPSAETIGDGSYGVARPLFFYVKNAHRNAIPGLQEFVEEYVSEESMGENGYLVERGLVPADEARREEVRTAATEGGEFTRYAD